MIVLSQGSTLSGVQKEKVNTVLQDVRAETPLFVAIMKSYVKSRNAFLVSLAVLSSQIYKS
jgi:hypothetical protein